MVPRSALRRPSAASTSSAPCGSSCDVGSSSTSACGAAASAPAIAHRCRSPPESVVGVAVAQVRDAERVEHLLDPAAHRVLGEPEVLEHEREVALDVVDDELGLGVLVRRSRRRRRARAGGACASTGRTTTTSPREPPAARVRDRARSRRAAACSSPSPTRRRRAAARPAATSRSTSCERRRGASGYANDTSRTIDDRAHRAGHRVGRQRATGSEQRRAARAGRGSEVRARASAAGWRPRRGCCRRRPSTTAIAIGASDRRRRR